MLVCTPRSFAFLNTINHPEKSGETTDAVLLEPGSIVQAEPRIAPVLSYTSTAVHNFLPWAFMSVHVSVLGAPSASPYSIWSLSSNGPGKAYHDIGFAPLNNS